MDKDCAKNPPQESQFDRNFGLTPFLDKKNCQPSGVPNK